MRTKSRGTRFCLSILNYEFSIAKVSMKFSDEFETRFAEMVTALSDQAVGAGADAAVCAGRSWIFCPTKSSRRSPVAWI